MSSSNYDTDSAVVFTFACTFFADTSGNADTLAANMITKIFGAKAASIMKQTSVSSSVLSGQDVSGSNYTYTYDMNWRAGGSDAGSPFYNALFAATPADALAAVRSNAQQVVGNQNIPCKLLYLKAE